MRCTFKTINKVRLCPSDLTHFVKVKKRDIVGDDPWSDVQDNTQFADVFSMWMACETVSPYKPVTGVNTGENITHIFYARHSDVTDCIDAKRDTLTIGCDVYRIDGIENLNMFNETIAFYCIANGQGYEASA